MKFQKEKKRQLEMKDNSDIGEWDEKILSLCNKINSRKEYYTTSSCAGRAVLIEDCEKKKSGLFLFRSHEKISFSELKKELEKARNKTYGLIYFKQEPCILHVASNSLEQAQKLLDKAKLAGWKNSGIIASCGRIILEMRSTEKLELPAVNQGKILFDDDFLKLLVSEANKKLERTWEKIKKLEKLI